MPDLYFAVKRRLEQEFNAFPMMFAFNEKQLEKGKQKLGVQQDSDLYRMPGGGFIRKSDADALKTLVERHNDEMSAALNDREFLIDAMEYELGNHEYCITHDPSDALDVLGIALDSDFRRECFIEARRRYMQQFTQ